MAPLQNICLGDPTRCLHQHNEHLASHKPSSASSAGVPICSTHREVLHFFQAE